MRMLAFARRNVREILRDPLSYCFTLGFPLVLLAVFQLVNASVDTPQPLFTLPYLTSGITVFSFSFVMLYMALLVSGDRATAFLTRLYCTPMTRSDFALGYLLPGLAIAVGQTVVCTLCAWLLGLATGDPIPLGRAAAQLAVLLPAMLLFAALGVTFGSLFSERAAPGMASIIISASGLLSGAWMPLEQMGRLQTICRALPFYPAVRVGRALVQATELSAVLPDLAVVTAYALAALLLAVAAQSRAMRAK